MKKEGLNLIKNKRGDNPLYAETIFIIATLLIFSMLFYFVYSSTSGAGIYEEAYAKEIALLLDSIKPGTSIVMDVNDSIDIANKNKKSLDSIFSIDKEGNYVKVSLRNNYGYKFKFFSNNKISMELRGSYLIITADKNV